MANKVRSYISSLEGNARVCIVLFPLWAVPYTVYNFYLGLYLKNQGFTDARIGDIMVAANVSALVCALIASPIVDRLGRRLATVVFDIASSVLPAVLFLILPVYPVAVCAMALTGLNRIMSIGYYLLMVEDRSERNGVVSMNLFNLILVLAGLVTPLAGILVERRGIVDSEKLFLLVSVLSMTAMALVRHRLVRETETGKRVRARLLAEKGGFPAVPLIRGYIETFGHIARDRKVASAVLVNSLVYVYYAVGTSASLLFAPYFAGHLGLSSGEVSWVGGTYAAGTLFAMVAFNPRLTRGTIPKFTAAACVVSLLGFAVLILARPGSLGAILCGVFLVAASYGILKTVADSVLALETAGDRRAGVYAFSFFFSSIVSVPAIKICSLLYARFPGWLFLISGTLVAGVLADSIRKLVRDA